MGREPGKPLEVACDIGGKQMVLRVPIKPRQPQKPWENA